jgi:hypothetical protein
MISIADLPWHIFDPTREAGMINSPRRQINALDDATRLI